MDTVTLWEKIKRGLQDGATTAAAKAEYLGKLGRARLEVARSRHTIHEAFAELGGLVYEDLSTDAAAVAKASALVQEQVARLKTLADALQEKEDALGSVKSGDEEQPSDEA
jgi:hypothetical protein